MTQGIEIKQLQYWDAKIRERAAAFGLSTVAQEFEFCDQEQMLSYMAYHGMPAHYPHWSHGKSFERLKTLYDHGVTGLPYEMVINADPCLAYLMRKNSPCLQILTVAHVYGHNDFFTNNFTFRATEPGEVVSRFKARADRVRGYVEDPSIGLARVERLLDAAHALSLQCGRNLAVRKRDRSEQIARAIAAAEPPPDPFRRIHKAPAYEAPDLDQLPLEPDDDILLFIRDHNPRLGAWAKDLLTIVHEEARYFMPQMQTRIMNEGWATYWHWEIMNRLDLPQELHLEFLVRHNQVVRPIPGDLNPYHLGFKIWQDIARQAEARRDDGRALLFEVREADRDSSFLRRFLSKELIRELGLFEYAPQGDQLVATEVADDEGWRTIKETLIRSVGTGGVPVIRVIETDHGLRGGLLLRHEHDGRGLHLEYAEKTLEQLHRLWGRGVALETVVDGEDVLLKSDDEGFELARA
jgi:stage V sporulation protein R